MSYRGLNRTLNNVAVNLNGDHQLSNAAIALCAIDVVSGLGYDASESQIRPSPFFGHLAGPPRNGTGETAHHTRRST